MNTTTNTDARTAEDSTEERLTSREWEERIAAEAEAEAQEAEAQDVELERTGRAYADAWQEYEAARSRLMHSLVYEEGSVAAIDRVAHRDLTGEERAELTERRLRAAQFAWSVFQDAERAYVLAVDDNMPVEFRQP